MSLISPDKFRKPIPKLKDVPAKPSRTPWVPEVKLVGARSSDESSRRICDSKRHWEDLEPALAEARRVHQHVYLCGLCNTWHLTSPKAVKPQAAKPQ